MVTKFENRDFGLYFGKMSIWLEIVENSRLRLKSRNIFAFGRNFRKIPILLEIFIKSGFWSKLLQNLFYGRNFQKNLKFV